MNIKESFKLKDVFIIENDLHYDKRGCFSELFRTEEFEKKTGLKIMQMNMSKSEPWTFRGMHMQKNFPQGKIVYCLDGQIVDFIVDCRKDSPTFGMHESYFLNGCDGLAVYVPPGFAHGFVALDYSFITYNLNKTNQRLITVMYMCTDIWHKDDEAGFKFDSKPDMKIGWTSNNDGVKFIVSEKDLALPPWEEFIKTL